MKLLLAWAAKAVDTDGKIIEIQALRANAKERGPWLLRIKHRRGTIDAVLKIGPAAPAYRITDVTMREALPASCRPHF